MLLYHVLRQRCGNVCVTFLNVVETLLQHYIVSWDYIRQDSCILIHGPRRCDSGFGSQLAKSLSSYGVHVYAGCLTESGGSSLRRESGNRVIPVTVDVTNTESVRKAAHYVTETLPKGKGRHMSDRVFILHPICILLSIKTCMT